MDGWYFLKKIESVGETAERIKEYLETQNSAEKYRVWKSDKNAFGLPSEYVHGDWADIYKEPERKKVSLKEILRNFREKFRFHKKVELPWIHLYSEYNSSDIEVTITGDTREKLGEILAGALGRETFLNSRLTNFLNGKIWQSQFSKN